MKTRVCNKCRKRGSVKQFYPRKKNGGQVGYIVWCKSCLRENNHRYYHSSEGQKHVSEYRKSDARKQALSKYNVSDKRKEVTRRYQETDKYAKGMDKVHSNPLWPKMRNARARARSAMLSGMIKKLPCEYLHLGNCHGRMEMHHNNYDYPLEIRWLCSRHHKFVNKTDLL